MALTATATKEASIFVKIIYPGGRVEFLNKPVLAAEIMSQNPKCWVTLPGVFQQPWAVLPPDASLALGQKFYVVPQSTVQKLRRHFLRSFHDQTTSPSCATRTPDPPPPPVSRRRARIEGVCLSFSTLKRPFSCLMHTSGGEADRLRRRKSSRRCRAVVVAKGAAGKGSPRRDDVSPGRRRRRRTRGSASPGTSTHNWQPSLQSISEE